MVFSMTGKRIKRVSVLLKTEIANIIQTRLKDPRVGFVTITEVICSADLKLAKVYFSVLGDKENTLKGLERARPFIQNELGSRLKLRYLPILHFYYDKSWEYGANIEKILHDLNLNHTEDKK